MKKLNQNTFDAAADSIAAAGRQPTIAGVRAITGGSFSTLTPMMKAWRAAQAAQSVDAVGVGDGVPSAVTDRLAGLGRDLWVVALNTAQRRFDAERVAVAVEREQERVVVADVLAAELEAERMGRERDAADAARRIGGLESELRDLRDDLAITRVDLAVARATMAILERQTAEQHEQLLSAIAAAVAPGATETTVPDGLTGGAVLDVDTGPDAVAGDAVLDTATGQDVGAVADPTVKRGRGRPRRNALVAGDGDAVANDAADDG
ncbi:MAG: hypothetical protein FJ247_14270 [Nitrospira sp.]|nr:hypothetical protein [Nitrospira sp.]